MLEIVTASCQKCINDEGSTNVYVYMSTKIYSCAFVEKLSVFCANIPILINC